MNFNVGPPLMPWNARPECSKTKKEFPAAGPAPTVETSAIRGSGKRET